MSDFLEDLAEAVKPSANGKQRLRFKGEEYILVGTKTYGGAIVTVEQYETDKCSFAYLMPNGIIMRFQKQIGTKADIEWLP